MLILLKKTNSADFEFIDKDSLNLKDLQELVGGLIEIPYIQKLNYREIDMVVNQDGKNGESEPNFAFIHKGEIVDMVFGDVVFIGRDEETGDAIGLAKGQIDFLANHLLDESSFVIYGERKLRVMEI